MELSVAGGRINPDGGAAAGNPAIPGGQPEIWSYGHRNLQSAALAPDGSLWTVEHGPRGGDELNRPEPGKNYGWPVITYGLEYSGRPIGSGITAREGMELMRRQHPDVVLCDVRLPDLSGLDVFDRMHAIDPRIPVIIMTAFAKTETAIEAMRRGAFEYLVKPMDFKALKHAVQRAIEVSRLSHVPAVVGDSESDDEASNTERIIGLSPAMQEVYKTIGRVASQDATVLILGESGTGKELVARAIYHYSQRSQKPFLAVNCAALPEALLESELFGHEKGAFTGADQRHIGKFEQVNGGTIFLDEIGDMSPATQAKALRLLQQQQFERIGGNANWGRDHWGYCFPAVLAGAGIRGGAVYGRSDKDAAYPQDKPVSPLNLGATIFRALGISADTRVHDALGRPVPVMEGGQPLMELFG